METRIWIVLGALLAGLAVAASAYGAHGLKPQVEKRLADPQRLEDFETAVRNQTIHALGIIVVGLVGRGTRRSWATCAAGGLFFAGIVLFCGGLYGYAIFDNHAFVSVAPAGGFAFMFGWLALAVAGWRCRAPAS